MTRTTIQISNPRDLPQLMAPLAFLLACDKVPQAGFEPDTGLTLELIVLKRGRAPLSTWWRSCNKWGSWRRRWSPREGGSHLSGRENWLEERKTWKERKLGENPIVAEFGDFVSDPLLWGRSSLDVQLINNFLLWRQLRQKRLHNSPPPVFEELAPPETQTD